MTSTDFTACGGAGGPGYRWVAIDGVVVQRWEIIRCVRAIDFTGEIALLANDGPWAGFRITLQYPSTSDQYRWASARIGRAVTLEEIYAAVPE